MILEYFRIDYKTDEEKDSIFFSQNPAPFYKFNQIWRLAPPIFRIPNRKIEYTSIRETGNFRKSRFNFAPPSLIRYWKRSARDGHGRRIDISFSGTTRYSAARFCPPPKGRSHFGQLKSDPREIDDRWIDEASTRLFSSRVDIVFSFFFSRKTPREERSWQEEGIFPTKEAQYINFRR